MKTCNNCEWFRTEGQGCERGIWCSKGHWDGIVTKEDFDSLSDETDCPDWHLAGKLGE